MHDYCSGSLYTSSKLHTPYSDLTATTITAQNVMYRLKGSTGGFEGYLPQKVIDWESLALWRP